MKHLFMKTVFTVLITSSLFLASTALAYNGENRACWDANIEADLAGYRVYIGSESGTVTGVLNPDVVNGREAVITDQGDGTVCDEPFKNYGQVFEGNYYMVVTAYDASGNESGHSNEVALEPLDTVAPADPANAFIK